VFRLGYNTNGLAHHRLLDAMRLLAELGYEGIALTPDVGHLDPFEADDRLVDDVRHWSDELGLEITIETGARFLLDARRKHYPTLLEEDAEARSRRVEFLCRCVDLAARLDAGVVSFWAGASPDGSVADWPAGDVRAAEPVWERLVDGVRQVLQRGRERGVRLGFEPEPGMFVATVAGFDELVERLGADGADLGLCLDVGHCLCTGDLAPAEAIRRYSERLVQVHLDDIAEGVHEHRMFGLGDLDLSGALNALLEVSYSGMAAVELSRDSHRGAQAAEEALARIRAALVSAG